ncbi:MAG: hypothetical protein ACO2ZM_09320 [Francisellaceae bacterium]
MSIPKPKRVYTATWLLYIASVLGILEILTSQSVKTAATPMISLDIVAYAVLFILAFIISIGFKSAKVAYIILAIIWYIAAIFILPFYYNHSLNITTIFIQVIITIIAFILLYQPKAIHWFNKKPYEGS